MALLTCPECGNEVSSSAKACPKCGYPFKEILKQQKTSGAQPSNQTTESDLHFTADNSLMEDQGAAPEAEIGAEAASKTALAVKLQTTKRAIRLITNQKKLIIICAVAILAVLTIVVGVAANHLDPVEKAAVQDAYELIDQIGTVESSSEAKIIKAENAFEALSPKCQRHVKNHKTLTQARSDYNQICADEVIKLINNIGKTIVIESGIGIQKARAAYENLTKNQQKRVLNYLTLKEDEKILSQVFIDDVIAKIDSLKTITLDSGNEINSVRKEYNGLTEDEQTSILNYSILTDAEDAYTKLAIEKCMTLISSIGTVTLNSESTINEANSYYNSLSDQGKVKVTNYAALTTAEDKLEDLKKEAEERARTLTPGSVVSSSQWQLTYSKTRLSAKVLPNDTSCWYMYYSSNDSQVFVDMVFTVKNISTDMLSLENAISGATVTYNGNYTYSSYKLYHSEGDQIDAVYSWDGIDALDSTTLHVVVSIPREAQSNSAPIKAEITIGGQSKIIQVR